MPRFCVAIFPRTRGAYCSRASPRRFARPAHLMTPSSKSASPVMRDPREEALFKQLVDEERRRVGLAEQTSPDRTPAARILTWEERHHLSMPRNPEHQLVNVIAQATALTRTEVVEEQRRRAEIRLAALSDATRAAGADADQSSATGAGAAPPPAP
jgi:hypothetical protein